MPPVLSVRALHKKLHSGSTVRVLFDSLSFAVERGEFVALMGRSGSGKTTLLNTLAGIEPIDAGEVLIEENSIHRLSETARAAFRLRNVGLVFQFFHLLPTLTIKENILLPSRFSNIPSSTSMQRYHQLVAATGITSLEQRYPHEVSGGEAQRAAIARALINQPAILLADEPTGNLDAETAKSILTLFQSLQEEFSLSILMVTHDHESASFTNRTLHFESGMVTA